MSETYFLFGLFGLAAIALCVILGLRRMAARAVARALAPEVAAMRWQAAALAAEIARRHRANEAFDRDFFRTWRLSEPQVFPAIGASFGLLPGPAIDRIGYFHAQLGAARERLAMAASDGGFEPSPYRTLSALVRAFNHVQPWVEPYLDLVTGHPPDMADANALLGELEDARAEPIAVAYLWADGCAAPG